MSNENEKEKVCVNFAVEKGPIISVDIPKFATGEILGSVHIKSKSKIKAREIVEIKIESSLS